MKTHAKNKDVHLNVFLSSLPFLAKYETASGRVKQSQRRVITVFLSSFR